MGSILLKSILIACIFTPSSYARDDFPKINDIFKSLSEDSQDTGAITQPPGMVVRNIAINLETINMSSFREKVEGYSKAFNTNASDENNLLAKEYNTRRLAWIGTWGDWTWASKILVQNKIYDLMLQTIYMARHKIKQIENDPYYNPGDTSYRIAYLLRNLLRIRRRAMDAYMTMRKNINRDWPLTRFLILHHKVARLHVDFLYLWWVMVRLNERYAFRHGLPNTTPKPGVYLYLTTVKPDWPLTRFLILHHKVARLHVDFLYLWWVMVRLNERYAFRHGLPNTTPKPGVYLYLTTVKP